MRRKPGKEAIRMANVEERHDCGWQLAFIIVRMAAFLTLLIPLNRAPELFPTQTLLSRQAWHQREGKTGTLQQLGEQG